MRHTLLLLLAVSLSLSAWSAPITQRQAISQASKFFASHGITMSAKSNVLRAPAAPKSSTASSPYYVVNAGDGNGFAIISGDDATVPVLGYSLKGNISEDNMPTNMKAFLDSYAEQIAYIQKNNISSVQKAPAADRASIAPMLTTTWDQGSPYSNVCPKVGGGYTSVTGCVATAMAQVLYYNYQHHSSTIAKATTATIPSYTCRTEWNGVQTNVPSVPSGSTIDWANMLDHYSYNGTESDAQKNAVANLMFYCGAAVKMDYGPESGNGSSASNASVADAFVRYFGFDASTKYVNRTDGGYTTTEWNNLVYNELANGRVVLYGGQSDAGSGHAFVIDGYDKDNFFYVDWGWSGVGDGAYLLSILSPSGSGIGAGTIDEGYNLDQDMVINAEPNHGGTGIQAAVMNFKQQGNTLSYSVQNVGADETTFEFGFGYFGILNRIIQTGTTRRATLPQTYYPNTPATINLSTLPNGTYNIVPIARVAGTTTWYNLWAGKTINVTVRNGNVTFNNTEGTPSLEASEINVSGGLKAGRTVNISSTLTNNGTADYEGMVYLFASTTSSKGSALTYQPIGVRTGASFDFSANWIPSAAGTYTLWLCSDEAGSNVLATKPNVVIEEGNGQYAMTVFNMTVEGEDASSQTIDSEGRIVTKVSGNSLVGTYELRANQTIPSSSEFTDFISKYNDATGTYEDYTVEAYPTGITYHGLSRDLNVNETLYEAFSFTNLPDGKYLIRPEVGTLMVSDRYYMDPELWYDDSHVYILGPSTGITSVTNSNPETVTVYNLQGMKVGVISPAAISSLPHGLYIINGKKVAVK